MVQGQELNSQDLYFGQEISWKTPFFTSKNFFEEFSIMTFFWGGGGGGRGGGGVNIHIFS